MSWFGGKRREPSAPDPAGPAVSETLDQYHPRASLSAGDRTLAQPGKVLASCGSCPPGRGRRPIAQGWFIWRSIGYPILIGTSLVPMPERTHAVPPFGAIEIAFALVTSSRGSGLLVTRLIGMTFSLTPRESIT